MQIITVMFTQKKRKVRKWKCTRPDEAQINCLKIF